MIIDIDNVDTSIARLAGKVVSAAVGSAGRWSAPRSLHGHSCLAVQARAGDPINP